MIDKFKLYCDRDYLKNVAICMIIFIGGLLYFIANGLSDRFGRRNIFRISIIIGCAGFIFFVSSINFFFAVFGLVLLVLTIDICNSLAYIYMSEISPPKLRNISSLAMLIAGNFGQIFGTLTAIIIMDYRYLATAFFIIALPVFAFYFWLKPTFFYLVRIGDKKRFLKLLMHILKSNRVRPEYIKARLRSNKIAYKEERLLDTSEIESKPRDIELWKVNSEENSNNQRLANFLKLNENDLETFFIPSKEKDKHSVSIKQHFSNCKNILKLIAYVFLVMNLYWVQGMTVFLPEMMGFQSVYLNNFLLSLADLVGISIMIFFLNNTRRKTLNKFHLIVILISSIILFILHATPLKKYKATLVFDIILSCNIFYVINYKAQYACVIHLPLDILLTIIMNFFQFLSEDFRLDWPCLWGEC